MATAQWRAQGQGPASEAACVRKRDTVATTLSIRCLCIHDSEPKCAIARSTDGSEGNGARQGVEG